MRQTRGRHQKQSGRVKNIVITVLCDFRLVFVWLYEHNNDSG